MEIKGQCLCHAVKFSFQLKKKEFDICHCSICRTWGGGPAFTVGSEGSINITGEENVTVFRSSKWAERGFCKHCGTHLFYRLRDQDFCNFSLGVLENSEDFVLEKQIYVDTKPDNYSFENKTPMWTEADVLKAFGAGS